MQDKPVGCAEGTAITVKNLFGSIPARKKYLKTAVTEYNHIMDLFLHYVLVYPSVAWKLVHNGKAVHQYPAVEKHEDRLRAVFGSDISSHLIPVKYSGASVSVSGFIGKPQIARNNRKLQYIFVNNRPVHEYVIAKQVKDAYASLLPRDAYPVFVLFVQVDPEKIDVNVHPRKVEVRFSEPREIYRTVYRGVGDALDSFDLQKAVDVPVSVNQAPFSAPRPQTTGGAPVVRSSSGSQPMAMSAPRPAPMPALAQQEMLVPDAMPSVAQEKKATVGRIVGQVHTSYIIVEAENGLEIYDQHAVSERIQYEAIKEQWLEKALSSQRLLLPQTIELATLEARIVLMNMAFFEKLGFEISELSNNSFMINAVPQELHDQDAVKIIKDIIGEMGGWEVGVFDKLSEGLIEPVDNLLKMMACRSAVMFGDALSNEEMHVMLETLKTLPNQYTCVHGRPCVLAYDKPTLNRMFKRPN
jgi:DNA mismatch repair protein MutL